MISRVAAFGTITVKEKKHAKHKSKLFRFFCGYQKSDTPYQKFDTRKA
jgi:hypothetical protein